MAANMKAMGSAFHPPRAASNVGIAAEDWMPTPNLGSDEGGGRWYNNRPRRWTDGRLNDEVSLPFPCTPSRLFLIRDPGWMRGEIVCR
jgi:hypothetical protein